MSSTPSTGLTDTQLEHEKRLKKFKTTRRNFRIIFAVWTLLSIYLLFFYLPLPFAILYFVVILAVLAIMLTWEVLWMRDHRKRVAAAAEATKTQQPTSPQPSTAPQSTPSPSTQQDTTTKG